MHAGQVTERLLVVAVSLVLLALGGCGAGSAHVLSIADTSNAIVDGTPVSLAEVAASSYGDRVLPREQIYSLRYVSRGVIVQAYLDVPLGEGPYPMLIYLHGGDITQQPGHWTGYPVFTAQLAAESANPGAIVFMPNYGGYGLSAGSICSPYDCFLDVENGLKALTYLRGLHVEKNATYPYGFSLGGYVALELAANDPQVRATVLDSPWPGALPFDAWVQETGLDSLSSTDIVFWLDQRNVYGSDRGSAAYKQNSVDFSTIHSPVLIIGGRSDQRNPPALLRYLRDRLTASHVKVTLDMVPGGHAPSTRQVYRLVQAWLRARGLRLRLAIPN